MHVAADAAAANQHKVEKAQPGQQPDQQEGQGDVAEGAQWLVKGVEAQDGAGLGFDEVPHVFLQARRPFCLIHLNRHALHGESQFARLDDRLQGVAKAGEDVEAQRRLPRIGAEAAGRVWHVCAADGAHQPAAQLLQRPLQRRKMGHPPHLPVADDDVGFARHHRRDQIGDVAAGILVVGVGVDDDVRPQAEAGVQPALEGAGQPLVLPVTDDVVDAEGVGNGRCLILAAIVNHQNFQAVNARQSAGQIGQRVRQRLRLIVARDLDDTFHR